jgi:hypothetical protein
MSTHIHQTLGHIRDKIQSMKKNLLNMNKGIEKNVIFPLPQ